MNTIEIRAFEQVDWLEWLGCLTFFSREIRHGYICTSCFEYKSSISMWKYSQLFVDNDWFSTKTRTLGTIENRMFCTFIYIGVLFEFHFGFNWISRQRIKRSTLFSSSKSTNSNDCWRSFSNSQILACWSKTSTDQLLVFDKSFFFCI